jgi:putative DNA primase/helicase
MRFDLNGPQPVEVRAPPWSGSDTYEVREQLGPRIGDIARRLLGPPNADQSSAGQLRFGSNGSVAVEIGGKEIGTWYDHEHKRGGGVIHLIEQIGGIPKGEVADWLKRELGIEIAKPKLTFGERIERIYDYRDAAGTLTSQVVRLRSPKKFVQRRPDGKGGWIWKVDGVDRVLYRLPELLAAEPLLPVWLVEGEKDADRLAGLGCIATTSPEGAGKWQSSFNEPLRGRHVVLLPDNDPAGREHMESIATNLKPIAESVRVLDLLGLPPKGDVSDWLDAGGTIDELMRLGEATEIFEPRPEQQQIALEGERPVTNMRTIKMGGGLLAENISEVEHGLIEAGLPYYEFGDDLVRIADGLVEVAISHAIKAITAPRIVPLTNMHLRDAMSAQMRFQVFDARGKKWIDRDPHTDLAEGLIHRAGQRNFPRLVAIVGAPLMRHDGTLLVAPGYDPATKLYLATHGLELPPIPARPSKADARRALSVLWRPFRKFPFVDKPSKASLFSAILSGLQRPVLSVVPAHVFDASSAGSGKGLIVNTIATILTGRPAPALAAAREPDETDKRVASKLLAGHTLINIDNVDHPIQSALINQMISEPQLDVRILGQSRTILVPYQRQ